MGGEFCLSNGQIQQRTWKFLVHQVEIPKKICDAKIKYGVFIGHLIKELIKDQFLEKH